MRPVKAWVASVTILKRRSGQLGARPVRDRCAKFIRLPGPAGFDRAVVGVIGHLCKTAMMANVVGAEAPPEAPSHLVR